MYDDLINEAAARNGVSPGTLQRFMQIESSGNPRAVSKAGYKGLFGIGAREWKQYGGGGDIFNPADNINAAAKMLADHSSHFAKATGNAPDDADLYLIHQQGRSGAVAHATNPGGKAWENVEEFYPNERVAKAAIWGNLSGEDKARFGSVDNVTSKDFMDTWRGKVMGPTDAAANVIPPGVTPTLVTTTQEQPPAEGVESERATNEFDKVKTEPSKAAVSLDDKLADLDTHLSGSKALYGGAAPTPAAVASAAAPVVGGIGGPAGAALGGAAAAPAVAPGLNPYLLAQMMQTAQEKPQPQAPANVLASLANPAAASSANTQNMLRLMVAGRDKTNMLGALSGGGVVS